MACLWCARDRTQALCMWGTHSLYQLSFITYLSCKSSIVRDWHGDTCLWVTQASGRDKRSLQIKGHLLPGTENLCENQTKDSNITEKILTIGGKLSLIHPDNKHFIVTCSSKHFPSLKSYTCTVRVHLLNLSIFFVYLPFLLKYFSACLFMPFIYLLNVPCNLESFHISIFSPCFRLTLD